MRVQTKSESIKIVLGGLVLVTLIFNIQSADPINLPKLLLLIVVGTYCLRVIDFKKFRLKKWPFWSASIFIFTILLSAIFSENPKTGLLGDFQRRNGALTYILLVLIYVFFSQTEIKNIQKYFYPFFLASSIVVSGYAFFQSFGLDPFPWVNPYNPVISTLGNPNFSSAIMAIFCTFFVVFFFQPGSHPWNRLIIFLQVLILIYCIYRTGSKQGFVALFIGLGVSFGLYVWIYFRYIRYLILGLLFSLGFIGILGMLQMGPLKELIYKDSVSVRGYYWRAGFEMIKHNFLLGVGPDQYGDYFRLYREPGYGLKYGFAITSNNAHSVPIQIFATCGAIVGTTFILLYLIPLCMNLKDLVRRTKQDFLIFKIGIFGALITYISQSLISIDNIALSVWGWCLAGICLSFTNQQSDLSKQTNHMAVRKKTISLQDLMALLFSLLATVVIIFLYRSEQLANVARAYFNVKNSDTNYRSQFFSKAQSAFTAPFQSTSTQIDILGNVFDMGFRNEAINNFKKLAVEFPSNPDLIRSLVITSNFEGAEKDEEYFRSKLAKLDPYEFENLYRLGLIYKTEGKIEEMLRIKSMILKFAANSKYEELANADLILTK